MGQLCSASTKQAVEADLREDFVVSDLLRIDPFDPDGKPTQRRPKKRKHDIISNGLSGCDEDLSAERGKYRAKVHKPCDSEDESSLDTSYSDRRTLSPLSPDKMRLSIEGFGRAVVTLAFDLDSPVTTRRQSTLHTVPEAEDSVGHGSADSPKSSTEHVAATADKHLDSLEEDALEEKAESSVASEQCIQCCIEADGQQEKATAAKTSEEQSCVTMDDIGPQCSHTKAVTDSSEKRSPSKLQENQETGAAQASLDDTHNSSSSLHLASGSSALSPHPGSHIPRLCKSFRHGSNATPAGSAAPRSTRLARLDALSPEVAESRIPLPSGLPAYQQQQTPLKSSLSFPNRSVFCLCNNVYTSHLMLQTCTADTRRQNRQHVITRTIQAKRASRGLWNP